MLCQSRDSLTARGEDYGGTGEKCEEKGEQRGAVMN